MRKVISHIACHISLALLCAGCGFLPMYSENSELQDRLSNIYISPISGTNGIELRNYLILSWNTANDIGSKYNLKVELNEPETVFKGLQRTGDATWEEVRIRASWTLAEDKDIIAKSTETASESYTFVSDLVSANASKISATENAIQQIGEKIEMKVNAKLKDMAKYED